MQSPHTAREVACRGEAGEAELARLGGILNMTRITVHAINTESFGRVGGSWKRCKCLEGQKQWKKHRTEKVMYFEVCAEHT